MHTELFREHIQKIWGWDDEWQMTNFQKEWKEAVTEVIHEGDDLLGYIQTRPEPGHLYVLNLGLAARVQHQGIGTEVMEILKSRATTQNIPMRLSVFKTNQRVIAFYERLGFKTDKTTETGCEMFWSPRRSALTKAE